MGVSTWGTKPVTRQVAAGVALLVAAAAAIQHLFGASTSNADHTAKRWHSVEISKPDPYFSFLLNPAVRKAGIPASNQPMDWSLPHVQVYSVPALDAPHWRPTLRDLADSGQAHAIDFLAKDPTGATNAWSRLQDALMDTREFAVVEKDPFQFQRTLIATVTKGTDWSPGDRMEWTRVFVLPINFSFTGYNVAATENETVKIAGIEATKTRKISAELGLTVPGMEIPKARGATSKEYSVKEDSDIVSQYEKLGVDISARFFRIIRESEAGGDATGNTTISLSVKTDPVLIHRREPKNQDYFAKDDINGDDLVLLVSNSFLQGSAIETDPSKASITVSPQSPVPHCALKARVWMLFEKRQIKLDSNTDQFYDESQQDVTLLRNTDPPRDVEIVSADDVSPAIWSIRMLDPSNDSSKDHKTTSGGLTKESERGNENSLKLIGGRIDETSPYRELVFTDNLRASAVAYWIRTHPGQKLSNLIFNYSGRGSLVPIRKNDDECRPGYDMGSRIVVQP